jgi:glyoxylase-like metal-dependent hydrolase (beta-lactamase superfamily II)
MNRKIKIFILRRLAFLVAYSILFLNNILSAKNNISFQLPESFIKVESLKNGIVLIRFGYDAITAIETQKGIVVIDAGISTGLTAIYRKIIENEFQNNKIAYLINTHGHSDHTGGNTVFADAVIIGHENCQSEISNQWKYPEKVKSSLNKIVEDYDKELKSLVPGTAEWNDVLCQKTRYQYAWYDALNNSSVTKPNKTFTDNLDIDMGDVKFNLIYFGKAHSESDIIIHIPEKKLLMVGDLFSKYGKPGFSNKVQYAERWLKVIEWIEYRLAYIDIVIDGHGKIMSKDDLQSFNNHIKKMQQIKE